MDPYREEIRSIFLHHYQSSPPFEGATGEVFIYGAGKCGRDVLKVLTLKGIQVSGFLDAYLPAGSIVDGLPVQAPDEQQLSLSRRRQACVVLGIFNAFVDITEVLATLRFLGYQNVVTFFELHRHFAQEFGDRFWLTSPSYYYYFQDVIAEGFMSWTDDESRLLYKAIISFRLSGDISCLPAPSDADQYFDPLLVKLVHPVRFVDCGGFTGDTLDLLRKNCGRVDTIAVFEPDLKNFSALAGKLREKDSYYADQVFLYPCGNWSSTCLLSFTAGEGAASAVSSTGESVIQCVALDDVMPSFNPKMIKMDIEGAEVEALSGARHLIEKNRPVLAVSVYHAPDHLWKVPLLLKKWGLGYKLYLRCYNYSSFDAICYAILE